MQRSIYFLLLFILCLTHHHAHSSQPDKNQSENCTYHYTDSNLLQTVEHYQKDSSGHSVLYRRECLFWNEKNASGPCLISRVLEDANGQAVLCFSFLYNQKGQVVKETLAGNLSGVCKIPLCIGEDGYPLNNGVESYSTTYSYSTEDPGLLLKETKDNGIVTTHQYDPLTKQCTGKLSGYAGGLLARCFNIFDGEGLLVQTVVDDGQGHQPDDLRGVTQRKIINSQMGREPPLWGQPLRLETCYWDSETKQEVVLESETYCYSEQGRLVEQNFYDANGSLRYTLHHTYDENGQLISTADSRGEGTPPKEPVPKECFNQSGQCVASYDAYGNETAYAYDTFGRLISMELPAVLNVDDTPYHPAILRTYNIFDQVIRMSDGNGAKKVLSYNIRGKPVEVLYPDGSLERFTYFLDGELKEKVSREGIVESFERDEAGRVVRSKKAALTGKLLQQLSYTYRGDLVQTVTDGQTTTRFSYDGAGRQIGALQETADGFKRLEWSYDASGQKAQTREWFGPAAEDFVIKAEERDAWQNPLAVRFENPKGQLHYRMDSKNSPQSDADFVFTRVSSILNSLNQIVKQEEKVDGFGTRHLYIYDALQRLETVIKYNSIGVKLGECHFRYDDQGNKLLEKHSVLSAGQELGVFTIRWTYDAWGRVLSIREEMREGSFLPSKTTRFCYDLQGRLTEMVKPDGTSLYCRYDDHGQLTFFGASDHSFAYQYRYDHLQRLSAIQDLCHNREQTRCYNAFHELTEEQQGPGIKICSAFDLAGRRIQVSLPDATSINYHYQGPLLASVERLDANRQTLYLHSYAYNTEGRLQTQTLLNGLGTVENKYDSRGRLVSIESPWWSQRLEEDGFDPYGRLLKMEIQDSIGVMRPVFDYGEDGQLAHEEGHDYVYDSLLNRLSHNGQSWKVNALNQVVQTPDASFVYDANGNIIEKILDGKSVFYQYDALNRLTRVEFPGEQAISYLYDAFDRRMEQRLWEWQGEEGWNVRSTDRFLYDGLNEMGKLDENGRFVELRILGEGKGAEVGAAVALELCGKLFVPLHDSLGSVRCLVDALTGEAAETYRYTAYGQESLWDSRGEPLEYSLAGNPWRFGSKRMDEQTGLSFFGKRYYDSALGRWMTPDPLFFYDTPNLYAFVRNDPLNHYDLYGQFSLSQIGDMASQAFFTCFNFVLKSAHHVKLKLSAELKLPPQVGTELGKAGKCLFGDSTYLLMGHSCEETQIGCYGNREISDKVRVTFINGILTTQSTMWYNLDVISQCHGGVKVHYIFRPTEGWTWDISRAITIKMAFQFGLRSMHATLLALMWRGLIREMGGIEGGGTIIHYAHSLGGSETHRARELLLPEEQKMIRVITFGSSTLIPNEGFQNVVNNVSVKDGVSSIFIDPMGHLCNCFDENSNVHFHGSFWTLPLWPADHLINGPTYGPVLHQLGDQFLAEFAQG